MKTTRRGLDMQQLSMGVARPGIDPRISISLAVVDPDGEQGFDPESGVYVDIRLIPTNEPETVYVPSEWTGGNGGTFHPMAKGTILLVAVVRGDFANGAHIIKRLWSPKDPPPSELASDTDPEEPTDKHVIRVPDGATLRFIGKVGAHVKFELEGPGKFEVQAKGGAEVHLESETKVTVKAPKVFAGTGGAKPVGRIGDTVKGMIYATAGVPTAPPSPCIAGTPLAPNPGGPGIPFEGVIVTGSASLDGGD